MAIDEANVCLVEAKSDADAALVPRQAHETGRHPRTRDLCTSGHVNGTHVDEEQDAHQSNGIERFKSVAVRLGLVARAECFANDLIPFVLFLLVVVDVRTTARIDLLKADRDNVRQAGLIPVVVFNVPLEPFFEEKIVWSRSVVHIECADQDVKGFVGGVFVLAFFEAFFQPFAGVGGRRHREYEGVPFAFSLSGCCCRF